MFLKLLYQVRYLLLKVGLLSYHALRMMLIKYLNFMSNDFTITLLLEEGGNRLAYLIASDELQGVSGRALLQRPTGAARVSNEIPERVRQEYQ
jgi:hypothetical protein